jgi:hypothetical protein
VERGDFALAGARGKRGFREAKGEIYESVNRFEDGCREWFFGY